MKKIITTILIIITFSCSIIDDTKGTAVLNIEINQNSRNLTPDLEVVKYIVEGQGPDSGDTFSKEFAANASITVSNLVIGTWDITLDAINASGEKIGTGTNSVLLELNKSTTLTIDLNPLATTGTGTIEINLNIPNPGYTNPKIVAYLAKHGDLGTQIPMNFTLSEDKLSATYNNNGNPIASGYYILNIVLSDDNGIGLDDKKSGKTVVLRIMDELSTSATIDFEIEDRGYHTSMVPSLEKDISLSITGSQTKSIGNNATYEVTIPSGVSGVDYTWYVNGEIKGNNSNTLTLGEKLLSGEYSIMCLVSKSYEIYSSAITSLKIVTGAPVFTGKIYHTTNSPDNFNLYWDNVSDDITSSNLLEIKIVKSEDDLLIDTITEVDAILNTDEKCLQDWNQFSNFYNGISHTSMNPLYIRILVKDYDNNKTLSDPFIYYPPICVSKTGDDVTGDGSVYTPYATISKALTEAKVSQIQEIWVGQGQYNEASTLVIDSDITIRGGYKTNFTEREINNNGYPTTQIRSEAGYFIGAYIPTIHFEKSVTRNTLFEGFLIMGPDNESSGGNVAILIHGSPVIKDNVIIPSNNEQLSPGLKSLIQVNSYSNYESDTYTAAPLIVNNIIESDDRTAGALIDCLESGTIMNSGTLVIKNNNFKIGNVSGIAVSYDRANIDIDSNLFNSYQMGACAIEIIKSGNQDNIINNSFNLTGDYSVCIDEIDSATSDPVSVTGNLFIKQSGQSLAIYSDEATYRTEVPEEQNKEIVNDETTFNTKQISLRNTGDFKTLNEFNNELKVVTGGPVE